MILILLLCVIPFVNCLDNGLARLPPIGFNSWAYFECTVTSKAMRQQVDFMAEHNWARLGYQYVNVDGCWEDLTRGKDGKQRGNTTTFPEGMAALADYIHARGFLAGLYTDRGGLTCRQRPGSAGHVQMDAQTYAEWGYDFLKEDSCNATHVEKPTLEEFSLMRNALNRTGRPILFSLCWDEFLAKPGAKIANMWRVANDCDSWDQMLQAMDVAAVTAQYSGPGGWTDLDMIASSSPRAVKKVAPHQSRAQFTMWCVMTSPILISADLPTASAWDIETFTNADLLLRVNQDPGAHPSFRVAGGSLRSGESTFVIWAKPLANGSVAIGLLNNNQEPPLSAVDAIQCDAECFSRLPFSNATGAIAVYDCWKHEVVRTLPPHTKHFSMPVRRGGAASAFILTPT